MCAPCTGVQCSLIDLPESVQINFGAQRHGMLGGDHMRPPELSQDLKTLPPVLPITRDVEDCTPIVGPAVQMAPVPIKHVHQPLHLHSSTTRHAMLLHDLSEHLQAFLGHLAEEAGDAASLLALEC